MPFEVAMMDLNTRQYARVNLELRLRFEVQLHHRGQVDMVGSESNLTVPTRDISEGGLSFTSRVFLPRGTLLDLELEGLEEAAGRDGQTDAASMAGRVQRCVMVGREPSYLVSVAFVDLDASLRDQIHHMVDRRMNQRASNVPAAAPVTP